MRVLHVITDTDRRGAQVFASDLAGRLRAAPAGGDHAVVALAPGGAGAQLDLPTLGTTRFGSQTLRALRRRMRGADVVVAHGSSTLLTCTTAGLGLRRPVVYRNISDPAYWLRDRSRRLRVSLLLRRSARVVALWPGGARYLEDQLHVAPDRIAVIPNGVPEEQFRPPTPPERAAARARFGLPEHGVVLTYAAALQPEKHPETAIRALAHLPPDVRLVLIGDGPMRAEMERLAAEVAPGRVVLAGQIDDPLQAYWAADALVLPSEGEGLPAVLIEAALCGCPCVASTSGGNASIVLDGRTGAVVPPADPVRLAEGVTRVLAESEQLGRTAREHCLRTFAMDTVTAQWLHLLMVVTR